MKSAGRGIWHLLGATSLLAAVALFDFATGYDVSVTVLYTLPVAWASWSLGLFAGFIASVAAAGAWFWADWAAGHRYVHPWMAIDRAGNFFLILAFIAFSFHHFRRRVRRGEEQLKPIEGILSVCSCCNRIRSEDGVWTSLGTFLREHTLANPKTSVCPTCAQEHYAKSPQR